MAQYHIKTLGCKVNWCDSCAMGDTLKRLGHRPGPLHGADIVIVNTCAVTAEAERKSRQAVRNAARETPAARIIVCGCAAQRAPESFENLPGVAAVRGTAGREDTARIAAGELDACPTAALPQIFEEHPACDQQGHTRAFIKAQEGCDNFCAYCVIPSVRGAPRSRAPQAISRQRDALVAAGYRELVLTGINLAKYGRDLGNASLIDALRAAYTPGVRLRLGSLEPEGVDEAFFEALLASDIELCPHFHVSLQSGSTPVLQAMGRRYTAQEYAAGIALIRRYLPEAAITTDVIVGFPGEGEAEFAQSLTFVEAIGFSKVHVFPYSPRPGTAGALKKTLPREMLETRAQRMQEIARTAERNFYAGLVGKTRTVLLETSAPGEPGVMRGHGEDYSVLRVPLKHARGMLYTVRITRAFDTYACAEVEA